MIPLPEPVQLSDNIQPLALPQHCVEVDKGGLDVYAIGVGQTDLAQKIGDLDGALRQAIFTTLPRSEYGALLTGIVGMNPPSIILAKSNESDAGAGDSGTLEKGICGIYSI